MKKLLLLLLLVLTLTACDVAPVSAPSTGESRTHDIAILYTGDVHVALDSEMGYEGLAALQQELTADNMEVLLVDTGDAIQGAPLGKLSEGEITIDVMNELGYVAMTLGNHEFDYDIERLKELSEKANFPFLSLNFLDSEGNPVYKPYTIVECDGEKIAFVGVSTPKTITSSTPAFFQNDLGEVVYSFMQGDDGSTLWAGTQQAVDAARADGADYVIALTHLGIENSTTPYLSTNLIAATNGIDVVLDGHSHSVLPCERVKNKDGKRILLSATGGNLENIGYLLLNKEGNISTGLVSDYEKKDEKIAKSIAEKKADFEKLLKQPVAKIVNDLVIEDPETSIRIVRSAETNIGSLCADAIRTAADADIAIQNAGGVRSGLPTGSVTYGDALAVYPFGNQLCVLEATGQQILDALELSVNKTPEEFGGFLQVSGLTYSFRTDLPSPVQFDQNGMFTGIQGERRVQQVKVGESPLDPASTYTLAGAEYTLLSRGDGYTMFADSKVLKTQFAVDYDTLIDYLANDYDKNSDQYKNPYGNERIVALP